MFARSCTLSLPLWLKFPQTLFSKLNKVRVMASFLARPTRKVSIKHAHMSNLFLLRLPTGEFSVFSQLHYHFYIRVYIESLSAPVVHHSSFQRLPQDISAALLKINNYYCASWLIGLHVYIVDYSLA